MSKEIEAFDKIVNLKDELEDIVNDLPCCFETTELDGSEEEIVDRGLKTLDIIRKKIFPLLKFTFIASAEDKANYFTINHNWDRDMYLTQEEYNLLREILA